MSIAVSHAESEKRPKPPAKLRCPYCSRITHAADLHERTDNNGYNDRVTWQQWNCTSCGSWVDWKPGQYDAWVSGTR
jgi:C4-type Zn-finger protein